MNIVTVIVVYVICWWLVFFMALPIGVRRDETPEPGHDPGAPVKPSLWRKAGWTSLIALLLTVLWWYIDRAGLISFRP